MISEDRMQELSDKHNVLREKIESLREKEIYLREQAVRMEKINQEIAEKIKYIKAKYQF